MNTPKSQNPEGKVGDVAWLVVDRNFKMPLGGDCSFQGVYWTRFLTESEEKAERSRASCASENPEGNYEIISLITATALADAERRAQYWKDEHLAGNTVIDAMQRRLEAALAIADRVECHDFDHLPTIANELRTLLRGDGKGEGVSTDEGEGL